MTAEHKERLKRWSETVDAWRLFPRAFIIFYFWMTYTTVMWFIGLPAPTLEQAGFASAVIGAGAAWFGLYVNTRPKANDQSE